MRKITIPRKALETKRLFVATPMYGGQCCGGYVHGLLDLNTMLVAAGFNLQHFSMANESLVTRARNYCAREFLLGDCTHLLFVDADIGFRADDALSLLAIADEDSDKDILCGLYPKKSINWDKILKAAKNGSDADELANCGSELAFNPLCAERVEFDDHEPLEVMNCGAGFMMIQRRVFERYIEAHPERYYTSDGYDLNDADKGDIYNFFDTTVDANKRYLSEDFFFCDIVRKLGMKVWVAPWVQLHHLGHYRFKGNLQALSVPVDQADSQIIAPPENPIAANAA